MGIVSASNDRDLYRDVPDERETKKVKQKLETLLIDRWGVEQSAEAGKQKRGKKRVEVAMLRTS